MDLTLQFDCFPNRKFILTFILADISSPILGLDFLHTHHHMISNTHSFAVTIDDEQPSCLAIPESPDVNVENLSLGYTRARQRCFGLLALISRPQAFKVHLSF